MDNWLDISGPGRFAYCGHCLLEHNKGGLVGVVGHPGTIKVCCFRYRQRVRCTDGREWAPSPDLPQATTTDKSVARVFAEATGELGEGVYISCPDRPHKLLLSTATLREAMEKADLAGVKEIYLWVS